MPPRARLAVLMLLSVLVSGSPLLAADEPAEGPIRRVLEEQVAAWNRRDLEGYMAGYWRSPGLSFFSGGTRTLGFEATLARYRARYLGEGKEMGTLSFVDLAIERLGSGAAMARGDWRLAMADGSIRRGLFTVILRRRPEGWRIVHDHSSIE